MADVPIQCPSNHSFTYNATLCACNPGFVFNSTTKSCSLFQVNPSEWVVGYGVDYSINFPATIFSFDSIKKYTQSQAVVLEATLFVLVVWLLFCFCARFGSLGDGRTHWFKIRWWISRLDICFSTRHWLDDQKVVKKRKTELGGAFSIACWILFIGLLAALLYQIISNRSVEVHSVRATNAPELSAFVNDMEFNITTISSMSCSNLRGLGTLFTGNPGFADYRVAPLSTFVNYSCQNSTKGPTITLTCNSCKLFPDNAFVSWQFVDLPKDPAIAVGFEFNLTARNHVRKKHLSFVSGRLKNGSTGNGKPVTYRGRDPNILKFNLFPRLYHNLHGLKLIQPLFHEFLPGSSFSEIAQLQAALQSSNDGLINTTLYVTFLSAYVVEINNQNILGPVSFLADLGGLYCVSVGIFFYFMVQCEYRIKKFRHEDSVMRRIRGRRKAQERWNKLRKYVAYRWGHCPLPPEDESFRKEPYCAGFMIESLQNEGPSFKLRRRNMKDSTSLSRKVNLPSQKKAIPEQMYSQGLCRGFDDSESKVEAGFTHASSEHVMDKMLSDVNDDGQAKFFDNADLPQSEVLSSGDHIPMPPSLATGHNCDISITDVQKNIESLYEYNMMLREKLVQAQSLLLTLTKKASS